MADPDHRQLTEEILLALGLLFLLFNIFPGIDIWVSALFYDGITGGWTAENAFFNAYRGAFNVTSIGLAVTCLVLWVVSVWRGPVFTVPQPVWGFVPLLYILGPGILVNGVLKNMWGRARPGDVVEFGGERSFSPAFVLSDQCDGNCSFVSGEGSGATAFFISVLVLSAYIPNKTLRHGILAVALAGASLAALLRVLKGRHFLSDTLGSVLFVSLVAVLLHWLLVGRAGGREKDTAHNT